MITDQKIAIEFSLRRAESKMTTVAALVVAVENE